MRLAALALACAGAAVAALPASAGAQTYVGYAAESPSDALARHLKRLATSPRDFEALVGAGKAALAIGDTQAAAGFFGRAEEVWPASALPQIGMGAALAHDGEAAAALTYFERAAQRGAAPTLLGLERGLAYDLLGNHAQAQADYRLALAGTDADEARRRLALSLAISGKKDEALSTLAPLMAKGDAAGARCRALVLAVSGDAAGARAALEARMPGSSAAMAYFFHKLPTLRSDQKAAAVHLGVFPGTDAQLASAAPAYSLPAPGNRVSEDRLASIEELLGQGAPSTTAAPLASSPAPAPARPIQVASANKPPPRATSPASTPKASAGAKRHWVQLASGPNADALPDQFRRIKSRHRDALEGINGYVAEDSGRARLLIGPFKDADDARIFASDLETLNVNAFSWASQPGQVVRKLPAE